MTMISLCNETADDNSCIIVLIKNVKKKEIPNQTTISKSLISTNMKGWRGEQFGSWLSSTTNGNHKRILLQARRHGLIIEHLMGDVFAYAKNASKLRRTVTSSLPFLPLFQAKSSSVLVLENTTFRSRSKNINYSILGSVVA